MLTNRQPGIRWYYSSIGVLVNVWFSQHMIKLLCTLYLMGTNGQQVVVLVGCLSVGAQEHVFPQVLEHGHN